MSVVRWFFFAFTVLYILNALTTAPAMQNGHCMLAIICMLAIMTTYLRDIARKK